MRSSLPEASAAIGAPEIGQIVHVSAKVCERPGMVRTPHRADFLPSLEPSLADGLWIELGAPGLTYKIWVPMSELVAPAARTAA